jgi:hypothetical protein
LFCFVFVFVFTLLSTEFSFSFSFLSQVIIYLKETSRQNTPDHSSASDHANNRHYELIIEAATMEEKVMWSSALQQHTEYIENISQNIKNLTEDGRIFSDEFNHYKSLTAFSPGTSVNDYRNLPKIPDYYLQSSINNRKPSDEDDGDKKNKKNPTSPRMNKTGGSGTHSPTSPTAVGSTSPKKKNNNTNNNPPKPLSLRQSVIHSQKYYIFIAADEIMIFSGLVSKPNKMSVPKIRELVFVKVKIPEENEGGAHNTLPFHTKPALSHPEGGNGPNSNNKNNENASSTQQQQQIVNSGGKLLKRLIYIDSSKYEVKGDIRWIEGEPFPIIKPVGERYFEVNDQRLKKVYQFYPKDDTKVSQWMEIFQNN